MTAVTIVADNAATLVREGGLINRGEPLPDNLTQWYACVECDHRMLQHEPHLTPKSHHVKDFTGIGGVWHKLEPDGVTPFTAEVRRVNPVEYVSATRAPAVELVGTVRVVDVHHADDCEMPDWNDAPPAPTRCPPGDVGEPGKWHLTVEPIDQGDDDE